MQGGDTDYVKGYQPIAAAQLARDQNPVCSYNPAVAAGWAAEAALPAKGMALEQFVCYDPADHDSAEAVINDMHGATKDALDHGYPPGKEALYLSVGMKDEDLYAARLKAPQFFRYQWKINRPWIQMTSETGCT